MTQPDCPSWPAEPRKVRESLGNEVLRPGEAACGCGGGGQTHARPCESGFRRSRSTMAENQLGRRHTPFGCMLKALKSGYGGPSERENQGLGGWGGGRTMTRPDCPSWPACAFFVPTESGYSAYAWMGSVKQHSGTPRPQILVRSIPRWVC